VPSRLDRRHAAIVWVHPAAGGGRSGSAFRASLTEQVAPLIDARVWNGNWTDTRYVAARSVLSRPEPAAPAAATPQSDRIGRCATEIEAEVGSTADVVAAIKSGAVTPWRTGAGRRAGHLFDLFRR